MTEALPPLPEAIESALAELMEAQFRLGMATRHLGPSAIHRDAPQVLAASAAIVSVCNALRAALAAPAVPQWQPIETAPRGSGMDGPGDTRHADYVAPPRLLLWTQEGPMVGYYDWFYHPGYGRGAEPDQPPWRDHDGGRTYGVTHWMPIPAAPTPQEPTRAEGE